MQYFRNSIWLDTLESHASAIILVAWAHISDNVSTVENEIKARITRVTHELDELVGLDIHWVTDKDHDTEWAESLLQSLVTLYPGTLGHTSSTSGEGHYDTLLDEAGRSPILYFVEVVVEGRHKDLLEVQGVIDEASGYSDVVNLREEWKEWDDEANEGHIRKELRTKRVDEKMLTKFTYAFPTGYPENFTEEKLNEVNPNVGFTVTKTRITKV